MIVSVELDILMTMKLKIRKERNYKSNHDSIYTYMFPMCSFVIRRHIIPIHSSLALRFQSTPHFSCSNYNASFLRLNFSQLLFIQVHVFFVNFWSDQDTTFIIWYCKRQLSIIIWSQSHHLRILVWRHHLLLTIHI